MQISLNRETYKKNIEFLKNIWKNENLEGVASYFGGGSTSSRENKERARKINLERFIDSIPPSRFFFGKIIIGREPNYRIRCIMNAITFEDGLNVVAETVCDLTEENYSFVKNLYEDIYKRNFTSNIK